MSLDEIGRWISEESSPTVYHPHRWQDLDPGNADDYGYLAEYDNRHAWAWELLRCNEHYERLYQEWKSNGSVKPYRPADKEPATRSRWEHFRRLYHNASGAWDLKRPADPDWSYLEAQPEFFEAVEITLPLLYPWDDMPWDVPPEPAEDAPSVWCGFPYLYPKIDIRHDTRTILEMLEERLQRFRQLAEEEALREPLERRRRPTVLWDQFPLYIRALHADRKGYGLGEIGRALYPAPGTDPDSQYGLAESLLETAKKRQERYRDLLLVPPYTTKQKERAKKKLRERSRKHRAKKKAAAARKNPA